MELPCKSTDWLLYDESIDLHLNERIAKWFYKLCSYEGPVKNMNFIYLTLIECIIRRYSNFSILYLLTS